MSPDGASSGYAGSGGTGPDGTNPGGADPATTLGLGRLIAARHDIVAVRPGEPGGGGAWHGPFRGRRRGQGMEFDDLRPYADGDDVRHVDWRTSARRNDLHTRPYREEMEHVVTIALDLRGSIFTGSKTLRGVSAGLVAARLAWRAAGGGRRAAGGGRRLSDRSRRALRRRCRAVAGGDLIERRFADARVLLIPATEGDAHVIGALRDAALLP